MLYGREGNYLKQEILVNARVRIVEERSFNNWNEGASGHELHLELPQDLYLSVVRQKEILRVAIRDDLNTIHNVQNEFIEEVYLEAEAREDIDWRRESGLVRTGRKHVPATVENRIWGDGYRVFLSHKAEVKEKAIDLKNTLALYGVSAFVAHTDICPTKEWQEEIESALSSMECFVALMTEGFHDSFWTDQEVGYALGRGVPMIAVKLDIDPYGFIGKFQALSCKWTNAPEKILKLLVQHSRMIDTYVEAVRTCKRFDDGNKLAKILPDIDRLADQQVDLLVSAFNENDQVRRSYGFNGEKSFLYGDGLAKHLSRITGRQYEVLSERLGLK